MKERIREINQVLRGHYAYYGIEGNLKALFKVYRFAERPCHKMLCSRSRKSYIPWEKYPLFKRAYPLQQPEVVVPFTKMKSLAVL